MDFAFCYGHLIGLPNATFKSGITTCWSPSPIVPSSGTCGTIWQKAIAVTACVRSWWCLQQSGDIRDRNKGDQDSYRGIETTPESKLFYVVSLLHYTRESVMIEERKSSNTKWSLIIYILSATLEASFILQCTIRILPHDHTHCYQHLYPSNHTISSNLATPHTTSLSYKAILPPLHSILTPPSPLQTAPPIWNTNHCVIPLYINISLFSYCHSQTWGVMVCPPEVQGRPSTFSNGSGFPE